MSIFISVVLVTVLGICTIIGWKKGFIRSLRGFISYIIAFSVANLTYRMLSKYIIGLSFLQGLVSDVEMPPVEANATFMDRISVAFRFITENISITDLEGSSKNAEAVLKNIIAETIADLVAFILIFVVICLILKFLLWLIDKAVSNTPVIRTANGLLGAVMGLCKGLFWTWILSNLFVKFLLPLLCSKFPELSAFDPTDSFVLELCTKINPIPYIFALINRIKG